MRLLLLAGLMPLAACTQPFGSDDLIAGVVTASQIAAVIEADCVEPEAVIRVRVPTSLVTVEVPGAELIARGVVEACA